MSDLQSVWPQWETVEKIGQGTYGKVYKIRRTDIGFISYAAMKIIEFPQDQSEVRELLNSGMDFQSVRMYYEDIKANLLNEIQVMESLKTGRNIVAIEDHCFQENEENIGWKIYIRMELLESLDNYLLRMKELSPDEVVKIGVDICSALECCEQTNVIHRDIKPDNIFRNRYGDYKLGDFGIAKQMEQTKSAYSHKGTSMYMAPEVYRGERYNRSVDIYSLGIMLYRLLNHGRYPFTPPASVPMVLSDQENALRKRMNGETMKLPDGAKNRLGSVVLKACAYKPEWRYSSASEFKAELLSVSEELDSQRNSGNTTINPVEETNRRSTEELQKPNEKEIPPKSEVEKTYSAWGDSLKKTEPREYESQHSKPRRSEPQQSEQQNQQLLSSGQKQNTIPQSSTSAKTEQNDNDRPKYQWVPNGESDELQETGGLSADQKKQRKKRRMIIGGIIGVVVLVLLAIGYKKKSLADREEVFENARYNRDCGYYNEAEEQYLAAIERYPDDSRGYLGLADVYLEIESYQDAMDILSEGKENSSDQNLEFSTMYEVASTKYEEAVKTNEYNALIEDAARFQQDGDYEQSTAAYLQAMEQDGSRPDAYSGIIQCCIKQNNLSEADKWLQTSASIVDEETMISLKKAYSLQQINNMMTASDYVGLRTYFVEHREELGAEYFQNGERVETIASGTGMIVSKYGVYLGEITEGKRNGQGKQFGTYSDDDIHYNVTEGQWSNDKANGQCIDTNTFKSGEGEEWIFVCTGNITDNLYDGDMSLQWSKSDGSKVDTATVHAEKGTFALIREKNGRYIYAESDEKKWSWGFATAEALSNNGVWDAY